MSPPAPPVARFAAPPVDRGLVWGLVQGLTLALVSSLFLSGCRQPPEPPRGVDENPPVEDVLNETVETAPETARVLLDTDWLVLTEVHLAPGAEIALHRDGERVAFAHNAHSLRLTPLSGGGGGTGAASSRSFPAGGAGTLPSGPLTVAAAGAGEARLVVVNRSSVPLPPAAGDGGGLAGVGNARELFQGDSRGSGARVSVLTLDGGGSHRIRNAPLEAIYVLGPGSLQLVPADAAGAADATDALAGAGAAGAERVGPGQARSVAGGYEVSNPGGTPTRLVVFQFER